MMPYANRVSRDSVIQEGHVTSFVWYSANGA